MYRPFAKQLAKKFALRLLMAMGASGLFEPWRVIEAGAIAWFYDGPDGGFEYRPMVPPAQCGQNLRLSVTSRSSLTRTECITGSDESVHPMPCSPE